MVPPPSPHHTPPTRGQAVKKWVQKNKFTSTVVVVAPLIAATMGVINLINAWDAWNLPRVVLSYELDRVREELHALELNVYQRNKMSDTRALLDVQQNIKDYTSKDKPVPDALLEQKSRLEDQIAQLQKKIDALESSVKNP
jgi:hypothetical protein